MLSVLTVFPTAAWLFAPVETLSMEDALTSTLCFP